MSKKSIIPLSIPNLKGREWRNVKECFNTNWLTSAGRFVHLFEDAVSGYTGAKHAIACINGTSGLFIALKLLGVGGKDEVIVPTLTFIAPVNAVRYLNAEPIFMDCDDYLNLDPVKLAYFLKEECRMTNRGLKNRRSGRIVKAIMPVHIFGNPCDMASIMNIARKYGLKVIEDATESLGSYYSAGAYKVRYTGAIGDFGVYSFNGNKIITTGGGGMIMTSSKNMADRARYLISQAKDDPVSYVHNEIGYNLSMSNLHASIGVAQLGGLEDFIRIKKRNYALYKKYLNGVAGIKLLGTPEGTRPNHWFYSLLVDKKEYGLDRQELMQKLAEKGIETRPIWYLSHMQKPYLKNQSYRIEKALWFLGMVLNIPCSTNLKEKDIMYISGAIRDARKNG